MLTLNWMKLGS